MREFYLNNGAREQEPVKAVLVSDNEIIINETKHIYEINRIADDIIFLRIEGKNYTIKLEDNSSADFRMFINGEPIEITCKSSRDVLREKFGMDSVTESMEHEVKSPMPGAVVKIHVSAGQTVTKGETLIVLEAMKMENELKSPKDCTVEKILVEEKQAVDKNQVLIELSK